MSEEHQQEIEELTELLHCPGWTRYVALVQDMYGPSQFAQMARQLRAEKALTTEQVGQQMLAKLAAMDAVGIALAVPQERVRKLMLRGAQ